MGIFNKLNREAVNGTALSIDANILSPEASSFLAPVIFHDVDESQFPVTISEAYSVPAVARAVGIYSGICSRFPLISDPYQPWLRNTTGVVTPQLRIAQTVQDLIFHNASVWAVERDEAGYVNNGIRVSPDRWGVDKDGYILIDGKNVNQNEVIYIASLLPLGFLNAARQSVRHYTSIAQTINARVANPEPVTVVAANDSWEGLDEEVDDLMDSLSDSINNKRGGLIYKPNGIDISGFGGGDTANQLYIEARNAVRLDLANHLHLNASFLEGHNAGASDIYQNALQTKSELLEFSIKLFTEPIADRLSQPDVTPDGVRLKFDYSSFETVDDAKGNVGTATETNND